MTHNKLFALAFMIIISKVSIVVPVFEKSKKKRFSFFFVPDTTKNPIVAFYGWS
jgi:hypothetical protein